MLGAYCGRKALRMDFFDATFHEAPPMATDLPATARAQEQRINELAAALQRKSAELAKARVPRAPPLAATHVNELAGTKMRFQWMNTLLSAMQGVQQVPLNAQVVVARCLRPKGLVFAAFGNRHPTTAPPDASTAIPPGTGVFYLG